MTLAADAAALRAVLPASSPWADPSPGMPVSPLYPYTGTYISQLQSGRMDPNGPIQVGGGMRYWGVDTSGIGGESDQTGATRFCTCKETGWYATS